MAPINNVAKQLPSSFTQGYADKTQWDLLSSDLWKAVCSQSCSPELSEVRLDLGLSLWLPGIPQLVSDQGSLSLGLHQGAPAESCVGGFI